MAKIHRLGKLGDFIRYKKTLPWSAGLLLKTHKVQLKSKETFQIQLIKIILTTGKQITLRMTVFKIKI